MSPELVAFLKAWLDWVEAGAPNGKPFYRRSGLCSCAEEYDPGLRNEIKKVFRAEVRGGLLECPVYPFGEGEFERDQDDDAMHLDENRLAWVREKLKAAGEIE